MITAELGLGVATIMLVASNALSLRDLREDVPAGDDAMDDEKAAAIAEAQSLLDNALPPARPRRPRAAMLEHNGLAVRRRRA